MLLFAKFAIIFAEKNKNKLKNRDWMLQNIKLAFGFAFFSKKT